MPPARGLDVALVGVTGVVGEEFLRLLEQREFPVRHLRPTASARSAGRTISFRGADVPVSDLEREDFVGCDVAFFSAGGDVSRRHARRVADAGAIVIDNSSAFRQDADVPLVVPQVNGSEALRHRGIIANPNCSTILLMMALAPLAAEVPLRRVIVSTYQAVSGSGAGALAEWEQQGVAERAGEPLVASIYPKPIHGNVIPFVQGFGVDDITIEEWKLVHETRRILSLPALPISATCVRVPVRRAHSEAVNVEFERPVPPDEVRAWLARAPGVRVVDDPAALSFPTPRDAEGGDDVLVGRIRRDPSCDRAVDLWLCGDQVRKGAALNAVEIAEWLGAAPGRSGPLSLTGPETGT